MFSLWLALLVLASGPTAQPKPTHLAAFGVVTEVETVSTGEVVYYGFNLTPPYIYGYDEVGRIFFRCPSDSTWNAEGLGWVLWNLGDSEYVTAEERQAMKGPIDLLTDTINVNVDLLRKTTGATSRIVAERKAELWRQSNLVETAYVDTSWHNEVLVRLKNGISFQCEEKDPIPGPGPTLLQQVQQHIDGDVYVLRLGGKVFVENNVIFSVPGRRIPEVQNELVGLRATGVLPERTIIKVPEILNRYTNPPAMTLRQIIERGGK